MTFEEREQIFSKEVLTTHDLMKIFNCGITTASKKMKEIKRRNDRLEIEGVCHIQDYIDAYELDIKRYLMPRKERPYEEAYGNGTIWRGSLE